MKNKFDYNLIEKQLGYTFKDKSLCFTAFTHSSYANLNNLTSNERLEFLGDSVLHFATTTFLYNNLSLSEGKLSRLRAYVVSAANLSNITKQMDLSKHVLFGKGKKAALSSSIKANLFEAILGAIYLDSDFETAKNWLYKKLNYSIDLFKDLLNNLIDYKTRLQEVVQVDPKNTLNYVIVNKTGSQHNPEYTAQVILNQKVVGEGIGKTKKEAENNAANKALTLLN